MSHRVNNVWLDSVRDRLDVLRKYMSPEKYAETKAIAEQRIESGEWDSLDIELDFIVESYTARV